MTFTKKRKAHWRITVDCQNCLKLIMNAIERYEIYAFNEEADFRQWLHAWRLGRRPASCRMACIQSYSVLGTDTTSMQSPGESEVYLPSWSRGVMAVSLMVHRSTYTIGKISLLNKWNMEITLSRVVSMLSLVLCLSSCQDRIDHICSGFGINLQQIEYKVVIK